MVVARIFGGLGNQMFIYAAAKQVAIINNTKLVIDDRSGFKKDFYKRVPELRLFDVNYETAGKAETFDFPMGHSLRAVIRKFRHSIPSGVVNYIYEDDFTKYHPYLLGAKGPRIFIEGFWQCQKYFENIIPQIRSDFEMICEHDTENTEVASAISQEQNAVCIHARRLHGVPNVAGATPNPKVQSLPLSYYTTAMQQIADKVPNPHFFCFSDYPEWFKENLKTDYQVTFITHNSYGKNRSHEDFWLMKHCRHFIISNSTFSWWAAWLSPYHDQQRMVFAPGNTYWDNKDIVPESWRTCS